MICSKCNSEIPDSSKFCTNCGATVSAPTDDKQFCENCGLELPKGAKFCAVCGAPVNKGASAEVKPFADVLEPVKLGAPISASAEMTSVKTEELSENSVSEAVPTENVESGYSIPIPTSETSMPAIDKSESAPAPASKGPWGNEGELLWQASENKAAAAAVSEPTNLESSEMGCIPESNYNETAAGYSAAASYSAPVSAPAPEPIPAPAYTAPRTNPMENPFGDYGMGAAAVAVKPVKKKSVAKYILIPVLSLIGAVLIAAGVLFFVNRSLFFNIILGNSGYAAMVEGNSIKEVTNKIDMGALSDGIKRATTRSGASAGMITGMGGAGYGITPTSSSYGFANSIPSGIDAKAMIESVKEAMEKSFGANSVKISTNFNIELTDSLKAQISSLLHCNESDIDDVVKQINGVSYIVDITADEKAFECGVEMTADGLKLNAKSIVDENGNVYLMLPFVSDKAFMVNIGTTSASQAGQVNSICIELDEKELKRITEKLVNTYLDVYKSCEIKIENGEVNVAGAIAKGKHITVNFTGAKIAELMQKTLETIVNDDYLCGKIVKFANDCGATITEDWLKNSVKNASDSNSFANLVPATSGIVIETVTDNNCRVIAKIYDVISGGKSVGKVSLAGEFDASTKNGKTAAVAVEANAKPIFTLYLEKTSDADGNCNIAVYNGDKKISLIAKYSEVKEATFCGKPITEGKIEFGIDLPSDFTENTESFGDISSVLSTMKFIVSVKTDGDSKLVGEFALDAPQYAKISMTSVVTAENKTSGIDVPSDVMDFTEITNSMGEIPDDMKKDIISYLKDMKNAVKSQNAGELGNSLASGLEEIIRMAENGPSADRNDIRELINNLSDMKREVLNFDSEYNNEDEILSARAKALSDEIGKLISNVSLKGFNMTENEYASFKSDYNRLSEVKASLEKEFAEGMGQTLGVGTKADNVDFTGLDIDSLTVVLLEYVSRYNAALGTANSAIGVNTGELNALLSDAEEKYSTAAEDFKNLYDLYDSGTLNLSFLRKSRKSTKAFAYAVEALENALGSAV